MNLNWKAVPPLAYATAVIVLTLVLCTVAITRAIGDVEAAVYSLPEAMHDH